MSEAALPPWRWPATPTSSPQLNQRNSGLESDIAALTEEASAIADSVRSTVGKLDEVSTAAEEATAELAV